MLIGLVLMAVLISLLGWWDNIFEALGGLQCVHQSGRLPADEHCPPGDVDRRGVIFDRRSYIVFTPGQIRVCEEIGGRERTYDTTGITIEKHRDDWFRHIILGFGTAT